MSKNKDFFNRIAIINECLRKRGKRWYVEDLLESVNERLSTDYDKTVCVRTLLYDLDYLEKEKDAFVEGCREYSQTS
jgi:hypothetical protein